MDKYLLDGAMALILFLFVLRGLLRGLVKELAGLLGVLLGAFVAARFYPMAVPHIAPHVADPFYQTLLAYGGIFAVVLIVVAIFAFALEKFMELTFTSWLNHLLGGVSGAAKGVLLCAIVLTLFQHFLPDSPFLKQSVLLPHINDIVSAAKTLLPPLPA